MEIPVKPINPNSANIATLRIPPSDFSLDSGLRLMMELLNPSGEIIDRQYLEMPLPNFVVDGKTVNAVEYLKAKALEKSGLQQVLASNAAPAVVLPNWRNLLSSVRGTPLFGKIYEAAKKSTQVQAAYTFILDTLTASEPSTQDLFFGLTELQTAMGASLLAEDVSTINTLLKANNFDFQLKLPTSPTTTTLTSGVLKL